MTRSRLDAALYEPAPERRPERTGRPRKVGKRLPTLSTLLDDPGTVWRSLTIDGWYGGHSCQLQITSAKSVWYHTGLPAIPIRWVLVKDPKGKFEPQAFLCTNPDVVPEQILLWFRQRWPVEVTFEEARVHLGVETQRQWSEKAISRTTPALFALFSLVVLLAERLKSLSLDSPLPRSSWYHKELPTFIDALAWVRGHFWQIQLFHPFHSNPDMVKIPRVLLDNWSALLCYAA